jgi:hypothetical protein
MEPNRTRESERHKKGNQRQPDNRRGDNETLRASAERQDDLEGQLGPDELPDADEVAMNLEAKRHH